MEQLLHYVWKHKLFPLQALTTSTGIALEVIDTGLHNPNAGPDFFNAKIKIDDTVWIGNVELHDKSSDWYRHHHDQDPSYDNVILHVVSEADSPVFNHAGRSLPQLVLPIPATVTAHYHELLLADHFPPCHRVIPTLSSFMLHSWMSALQTERLEQKTEAIMTRVTQCGGSWEDAYFITLARNYGFGINGAAFECWAKHLPLQSAAHHRDHLFQIEALFLGQAGLLAPESMTDAHRAKAQATAYYMQLKAEYDYLAHKFGLEPMDYRQWRFLRLRPQNFPHLRLAQLAALYHRRRTGLSLLLGCQDAQQVKTLLQPDTSAFWKTHYTFWSASERALGQLSPSSLDLLVINTAIPILFAYGQHRQDPTLCERALTFLEQLKPENNHIIRMWRDSDLQVQNAGDSQALIQLKSHYCDTKDCLRCRIGYAYLKGAPSSEPNNTHKL